MNVPATERDSSHCRGVNVEYEGTISASEWRHEWRTEVETTEEMWVEVSRERGERGGDTRHGDDEDRG